MWRLTHRWRLLFLLLPPQSAFSFYTSAELNAKASHLLRQSHLLEVYFLLLNIFFIFLQQCQNVTWEWELESLKKNVSVIITWGWVKEKLTFDFLTVLPECYMTEWKKRCANKDIFCCFSCLCQICFSVSPQRRASAEHALIFSNQRRSSLDPAMTNCDVTDEEIPLASLPPRAQIHILAMRDLIADYLFGLLTGVRQEFVSGTM